MPYNTRRKSLSLPSLGIHIPVSHAARAAAASRNAARPSTSSSSSSVSASRDDSGESHPSKRHKRSHGGSTVSDAIAIDQTPPPSPTVASVDMTATESSPSIDLDGINDDIVEAVIVQLQSTANRPHLVKELATVLTQHLSSVQHSANPCAIISSRLASYMKRPCWSALAPCPLAKELETVHPRRTYYFLTTRPRQPLPDFDAAPINHALIVTPSVSLTDDSGSDDVDDRRRELSPSPEVDLSPPEFDHVDDDFAMPATPIGSFSSYHSRVSHDPRHDSPPLEKDEREFTQTADGLQKRKLSEEKPAPETVERNSILMEYGYRDDIWFADSRPILSNTFLTSPSIKPSIATPFRKEDDTDNWLRLSSKLFEWDQGAESIEIDELDCLLDAC